MKEKNPEKERPGNFEKDLQKLEQIVQDLEKGELSLEESLKRFEEGIHLARRCEKALTEAERRIEILLQNEEGEIEPQPFDVSEAESASREETADDSQKVHHKKTSTKPKKSTLENNEGNLYLTDNEDLPF